ncbi:ABC transporter permease, partial [Klebsiella pneumoniae]|nr:ABC transporter permease [Klebsiella pneumoniae]
IVFAGVYAIGDPTEILVPAAATQAEIAQAVQSLGLDLPLYQQYLKFVGNALHGDLGTSFVHGIPAIELIVQRIPATFELVIVAIVLTCVLGIPLGL